MQTVTTNVATLFSDVDNAMNELMELIQSLSQQKINLVPFKDSWTPAQLAVHVTKSNKAITQALNMQGEHANRAIDEGVPHLQKMFLDFDIKYKSPEFIVPEERAYDKEEVIAALKKSIERMQYERVKIELSEIINLPPFGKVTKLELLHFVLYHTTRHVHQLKNMIHILNSKN
jgi:uncharacterized damage-inducible protein DinB